MRAVATRLRKLCPKPLLPSLSPDGRSRQAGGLAGLYVGRGLNCGRCCGSCGRLGRRPCCSPALWAVWFPRAGKLEPSDARTREMAVWRHRELVGMA